MLRYSKFLCLYGLWCHFPQCIVDVAGDLVDRDPVQLLRGCLPLKNYNSLILREESLDGV